MSDQPSPTPDLSGIDLSLSFAPAWAKETDSSERISRLAAKHEREDRPDRGPRREGRGGGGGERRDRDRDKRGPRQDRRPPREGGDKGRRHSRDREERRPEREQAPAITGWEIRFLPDRHGVEGLAKQIRSSAKAYPIFTLSRLVLEKSERYHVEFKRASEAATPLFQLKTDGSLWLSEREAVSRALSAHLESFYRREQVQVEPPKGVFNCVAVCGMSGVLLGPPNVHDYQTKLVRLHAERFANMPFEAFKSRVRMERDEATIQKWKDEQSVKMCSSPWIPRRSPSRRQLPPRRTKPPPRRKPPRQRPRKSRLPRRKLLWMPRPSRPRRAWSRPPSRWKPPTSRPPKQPSHRPRLQPGKRPRGFRSPKWSSTSASITRSAWWCRFASASSRRDRQP